MPPRGRKTRAEQPPRFTTSTRSGPRGEYVYKALLQSIRDGHLAPGERILEEDVAQLLGVSRTPVREALQLLQARRLVQASAGRGIIVAELSKQQVLELYALREILEGAAARFAAQHASGVEIAVLRNLLDEFTAARGNAQKLARINHAFHLAIYEAARNSYMYEALSNLDDAFSVLRSTTYTLNDRHASADREHRAIVAAIEARDAEAAEAAGRLHIRESQAARMTMLVDL